jgi:hypothetical protein
MNVHFLHPFVNSKSINVNRNNASIWLIYGETFINYKKWDSFFCKNNAKRFDIERKIESITHEEMGKHSLLINKIYKEFNGEKNKLWLSPIFEKNGWPPNIVLQKSIWSVIENVLSGQKVEDLYIVSSSNYILLKIKGYFKLHKHSRLVIHGRSYFIIGLFKKYLRTLNEIGSYFFDYIKNKINVLLYFRQREINKNNHHYVMLRTSPRDKSFKEDGTFVDPYFLNMYDILKEKGYEVLYQFNLSSVADKKLAYKWISQNKRYGVWLLENHLHLLDYIRAIYLAFKHFIFLHFLGKDFLYTADSFYIKEYANNYLKAQVPKKVKNDGIKVSRLIYFWENKAYEKYMNLEAKKYLAECITVGYAHVIPFPFNPMCNYSKEEANITPFPDKIVTCGEYVYDWLIKKGINNEKIIIGPALRHGYLAKIRPEEKRNVAYSKAKNILVALPLNRDLSIELCDFVYEYAKNNGIFTFFVKAHPALKSIHLEKIVEKMKSNPKIVITKDNLLKLLGQCEHFLYIGATSAPCEALVCGNSVLRYVSKLRETSDCLNSNLSYRKEDIYNHTDLDCLTSVSKSSDLKLLKYFYNLDYINDDELQVAAFIQ